ncbi:GNAT family N-acetyltransferase [Rhodoplanes sp. TEM]|uniref:GNAT family N-acetyltransferase n=1 Tax=Rhodoplanes tepidamans TaxID=200616 RepID=A0ABT5JIM9_RHOTP|nr:MULTISPECIES: GNAT family N-acetyltransferase [Rhodoplanes]MDC7789419.1 GNAT family N-acetyltransferase [Rhodoplanes tepidamans]MDC7986453.1 GNAT family N-acetyltransferase [Rhodoplanes sp. TEM]MDQ0358945.1 putative GNAT family acetyltransferase [Rhodoplanes tepidamans]
MTDITTGTVRDNPARSRFELGDGDALAVTHYRIADGAMVFTHTEVPSRLRGRGIASRLIAGALAAARERGLRVVPLCSFVAAYVSRHPEAADLVS